MFKGNIEYMFSDPPEEKAICHCSKCDCDIYRDVEFIEYDGDIICEFCLDDFSVNDWLELIGVSKKTAEPDMFNDEAYDKYDD